MMDDLTKVRASSLSGYPDCPRRSAARLFRSEIEAAGFQLRETPRGIGATVGTAVHAGAALTLKERLAHGSLASLSAMTDCAVESYREQAAEGVLFDRQTADGNVAEKQVVRLAATYQQQVAPAIEPVMVEERLEAETPFGLVLTGHGDVLAREDGRLRDLKTGKRRGNHRAQLGAYSMLMRSHGLNVETCSEDFLQRVPLTKPQPDAVRIDHDLPGAETAALNVLRHIADDLRIFREGDPDRGVLPGDPWAFAANPSSMLCSAKFCTAFGSSFCHEHKQESEP